MSSYIIQAHVREKLAPFSSLFKWNFQVGGDQEDKVRERGIVFRERDGEGEAQLFCDSLNDYHVLYSYKSKFNNFESV